MPMQHAENLLRRFKGQTVNIKTISGGVYEGVVAEITNDYVALTIDKGVDAHEQVFVLLHGIECVLPRGPA